MSHYISGGNILFLYKSPLQHHRIGSPQILRWFSKGCIWNSWKCDFVDPQGSFWRSYYQTQNNLDYLLVKNVKVNPQRNRNILSQLSFPYQNIDYLSELWSFLDCQVKTMERKGLIEFIATNVPHLENNFPIYFLTKSTKVTIGQTTDVSNPTSGLMFQMNFQFFNVEIIRVFTLYFVAIYPDTSFKKCISIRKKVSASWHPKIPCQYIEESG